ncbi:MAG: 6-phosphofructokinase [Phycisphaerae bacterium]|nr:6-phosphofructokinase [Phycisphaerae bacterium]
MNKSIAVFTSGGDAPGMNAAIRAVVRMAIASGYEVHGVIRGYQGLIDDNLRPMDSRSVSNIIQRGGTILHTARSKEFMTDEGQKKGAANLARRNVSALIGIGGDGTFHGLAALSRFWPGQIIGVPGTIDNDLFGTDYTIGYDTAINTALESIDRIRDTAESHDRFFLVEVMGRWAGFIALDVTVAGGAEYVVLPESGESLQQIADLLEAGLARGKRTGIVVVSERGKAGAVHEIAEKLEQLGRHEYRVAILGYIQRGGSPTARDRILASKLGAYAVQLAAEGQTGVMVGEIAGKPVATPLEQTWSRRDEKPLDPFLMEILPVLAQ